MHFPVQFLSTFGELLKEGDYIVSVLEKKVFVSMGVGGFTLASFSDNVPTSLYVINVGSPFVVTSLQFE